MNNEYMDKNLIDKIENEDKGLTTNQILNIKVNLELAGILFVDALSKINEGKKRFERLELEIQEYGKCYKRRLKKYKLGSDECITYLLPKLRDLEVYYEPVVSCFSTAKILLVCCAETYINEVSSTVLKGKSLDEFDKLSIVGKWIFAQELLNFKKKMTLDRNPFQGFSKLVKERNKLVHFKGYQKSIKSLEIPNYIDDLRLTPKDCFENYKNVKILIKDFCLNWTGSSGPDWLNADEDKEYRKPCFYLFNRKIPMVLYSEKDDKNRF